MTSRTTAAQISAPAKAPVTPVPTNAQVSQSAVKPLVDVNAPPAPATSAAAKPKVKHNDTLPIAGGALAFLAIGGAAVALTRRRHDEEEEEWTNDSQVDHDPVEAEATEAQHDHIMRTEEPAMVAPAASAFSWSDAERARESGGPIEDRSADDDRLPGETWVQQAYRGPTPNNPSVSLRARLKRAAFFDKRERDVAAGKAEPVDMDAGLPEAMIEEQERELA